MRRFLSLGLVLLAPLLLLGVVFGAAEPPIPATVPENVPNPQRIGQIGGPARRVATGNGVAYATIGPALTVLDVTGGTEPQRLGSVLLPEIPDGVAVSGTEVVVVGSRLRVIDVANPAQPSLRGSGTVGADYRDVAAGGGYAYAVAHSFEVPHGQLHVYDVRDGAAPTVVSNISLDVYAHGVAVSGPRVYVANGQQGLRILNVSNPAAPAELALFTTTAGAFDVALQGDYAFVLVAECVVACSGGVEIVDISQPQAPQSVGFWGLTERPERIHIDGQRAYIAGGDGGTTVLDISDPAQPVQVAKRLLGWSVTDVAVDAGKVLVAAPDYGVQLYLDNAQLSPTGALRTTSVALDVSGGPGPGGGELAYVGDAHGLRIADVTGETVIGVLERDRPVRGVAADYPLLYLANDSDGLFIVDVTTPTAPLVVGQYNTPGTAHDVVVDGDYAYVADGAGGLHVIDISNPAQPLEIGVQDTPGSARGVAIDGGRAYVADWDRGVRIIDVSNPAAPIDLSFYNTPGQAAGVDAAGAFVYVADSLYGLRIIDVGNPLAPVERGVLLTQRYVDDVAVIGGYAYVANDDGGLLVVDVTNPAAPVQVGSAGSSGRTLGVDISDQGVIYVADWIGGVRAFSHAVFSLSGVVNQANGVGMPGVGLSASGGAATTTGVNGAFSFDNLAPGSYAVTPTLSGYVFLPAQYVDVVPPDSDLLIFTILPPPLTATVTPGGQQVVFTDTQGLTTTLDFPAGAFSVTRTLIVTPTVAVGGAGLSFAGHALDLAVVGASSVVAFDQPVTLTVRYSEDDLRVIWDESTLALYWWNGSAWVPGTNCPTPGGGGHDVVGNVISMPICLTGRYALLGESARFFLPVVAR